MNKTNSTKVKNKKHSNIITIQTNNNNMNKIIIKQIII